MIVNQKIRNISMFKDDIYESLLNNEAKKIYLEWRSIGSVLTESTITQRQIQQIFQAIADGTNQGLNIDSLGQGATPSADAPRRGILGSIWQGWSNFKDKIAQSRPISGFDVAFDKLQQKILSKAGGKSGTVGKMLKAYKEFGNKYPRIQSAIYYGLTIAAALSGWGLGGSIVLAGLRTLNGLLQGERFSSAAWKGIKTAVLGAAAPQIFSAGAEALEKLSGGSSVSNFGGTGIAPTEPVGLEVGDKTDTSSDFGGTGIGPTEDPGLYKTTPFKVPAADSGGTLSQIAQKFNVSVRELLAANPELTNSDVLKQGQIIQIPSETGSAVYDKGVGTAADTMKKIASGEYTDSPISRAQAAKFGIKEGINIKKMNRIFENQKELKLPQRSAVYLNSIGLSIIFSACERKALRESILDTFKNKITKDKLDLFWRKNYGEYSQQDNVNVETVIQFLRRMGVKDGLIQRVFSELKIPTSTAAPADMEKITGMSTTDSKETAPVSSTSNTTLSNQPIGKSLPGVDDKFNGSQSDDSSSVSSTDVPIGTEIEFPGTNIVFKYENTPQWVTKDKKLPANQYPSKVLSQLAKGVSKDNINMRDLTSSRRNLHWDAVGMGAYESKMLKKKKRL